MSGVNTLGNYVPTNRVAWNREFCVFLQIRPGLGLDENFYAWSVAIFSIGELLTALSLSFATKIFPIKYLMIITQLSIIIGGLIYGFAVAGWMVMMGRFLQGVFQGGMSTIMRLYIGESTNIVISLKKEDPSKSQIKNTTFLFSFGTATAGVAIGPGKLILLFVVSHWSL